VESHRKSLNSQQTELRRLLSKADRFQEAIELFLSHHATLHSARMARTEAWSFEDEVLDDMTEAQVRRVPRNCEHSVAWCVWHIARCEDITMNLLVAGSPQVVLQGDWHGRMKVTARDTGNAMDARGMADFSAAVDVEALRDYRVAVGRRTREIVRQLDPKNLKRKADPSRLQRVMDEGAVVEAARGLIDYWGGRDVAGLLLMPASRHHIVHLNEALRLKKRRP